MLSDQEAENIKAMMKSRSANMNRIRFVGLSSLGRALNDRYDTPDGGSKARKVSTACIPGSNQFKKSR